MTTSPSIRLRQRIAESIPGLTNFSCDAPAKWKNDSPKQKNAVSTRCLSATALGMNEVILA